MNSFNPYHLIVVILWTAAIITLLSVITLSGCKHVAPAPEPLNQCQTDCINEDGRCQNNLGPQNCEEPFQGCIEQCRREK